MRSYQQSGYSLQDSIRFAREDLYGEQAPSITPSWLKAVGDMWWGLSPTERAEYTGINDFVYESLDNFMPVPDRIQYRDKTIHVSPTLSAYIHLKRKKGIFDYNEILVRWYAAAGAAQDQPSLAPETVTEPPKAKPKKAPQKTEENWESWIPDVMKGKMREPKGKNPPPKMPPGMQQFLGATE